MDSYYFNPKTQRYHYSAGDRKGQMIKNETVRFAREKAINSSNNKINDLTEQLSKGKIDLTKWESLVSRELTEQHTISYLLGIGGERFVEDSDLDAVNRRSKSELIYLRRLSEDYEQNRISPAMLKSRIKMFGRSQRGTYEAAKQVSHERNGFIWERRILTKSENCYSCYIYALRGWQRIGTLPPPTVRCECRSNCGCYKIYSKDVFPEEKGEEYNLLTSAGWIGP
jgi:hypothetical protein